MNPAISVIMPVYNSAKFLRLAVESILDQTFKDFEFLIINDGSTDESEAILLEHAARDPRIVYIKNETNIGLIASLNKALSLAKGKYIARMDGDDVSLPERLAKQVSYLEENNTVAVL